MFRIGLIIYMAILLAGPVAQGQERKDFRYYDSLTYSQYTEARWQELTVSSREAISLGHDFYYMRMRLGISLFERHKYLLAVRHFRKATEFNQDDPVAAEYIYYCYLNAGDEQVASAVSAELGDAVKQRVGIDNAPPNRISLDQLFNNAITEKLVADYTSLMGYGEAGNLLIPLYYTNTGLLLSSRVSSTTIMNYGLTYLGKKSLLSYSDGTNGYDLYDQSLHQVQIYLSPVITGPKGVTVSPALHYVNSGYTLLGIGTFGMNQQFYSYRVNESNIVTSLSLGFTRGVSKIGLEGGWSYLNFSHHLQAKGSYIIRPSGNARFYFGGSAAVKFDEVNDELHQGIVWGGLIGFGIADRIWLDFSGLSGDILNYTDKNGYLVYNGINRIDYLLKGDISLKVGKNGSWLSCGTRYGSEYNAFIPDGELNPIPGNNNNYKSFSIIGGISWLF